ncbi:MAG: hypothetical protein QXT19_02620 [Candidatus Woesearchaeota archaeon]
MLIMVNSIITQAQDLKAKIQLFPPAKEGTIMRKVLFMINKVVYQPERNSAVVEVWYGSPPDIENEFFNLGDYWSDIMAVLHKSPKLGEKAKTILGFEHALHTYYHLKMDAAEQKQYNGLYKSITNDLQTLLASLFGQARVMEESGQLKYEIVLPYVPRGVVSLNTGEQRNFAVLEDKLFLDPAQVKLLRNFLWSDAARARKPYSTELKGLVYKTPR